MSRKAKFINVSGTTWKLEDAKARFSEVVRRARTEGPQTVTTRGRDPVVVIAVEDLARLTPPQPRRQPLVQYLESLHGGDDLEPVRDRDLGRDIDL
ncbi:type II toxin-antitoxin system Phd/YefM family antitoxin [Nitrospirillum sp. BR 11163]|uniref:type II toxin-antitoxin system Phd/YefM family antitoxin n=1 Tax=Nitrospirillum sp. BR 11163 TaxID=3104323 RepID=UPI002AFEB9DD|nr:type II toxin-antitoxin system Phd/YefM family antitoxin [Nitrospirillum sp. BR 11163]MEA1674055.1 type II toxin-antitoxin system Phd/YefM family antitoxin [Nitrospirillum sp. BR 11163]